MRIVVLGVSGMLGSTAFRLLCERPDFEVYGTARTGDVRAFFDESRGSSIRSGVDVENPDALVALFRDIRPDVVINCVGVVKQLASAKDPLVAIPLNALLPHRLARLADVAGARLVHISTDCVFSGSQGNYDESAPPDADDLYGRSKLLGEVDYPHAVTLRTSIIGHELTSRNGLVDWFLGQSGTVRGFKQAIFSGLTTDELTRVIADRILPHPELHGLYHVSVDPISKYDLLHHVRSTYQHPVEIEPDDAVVIDRSLNSDRFRVATGYAPPNWPQLIETMRRTHPTARRS